MVLISTVSCLLLVLLVVVLLTPNLVHEGPARCLCLRPLPCEQPQRHSKSFDEAHKQFLHAAAGSNGLLRAAGVKSGWRATPRMLPKIAMMMAPRLAPPSPPTCTPAESTKLGVRGHNLSAEPHSGRFERRAARGGGAEQRHASSCGLVESEGGRAVDRALRR